MYQKARVVDTRQKYKATAHMDPLEDYNSYASPPFVSKDQKGLKT